MKFTVCATLLVLLFSAWPLYAGVQADVDENSGGKKWLSFDINEYNSPVIREIRDFPYADEKPEILKVFSRGVGYALPFEGDIEEEEKFASKRAERDAFLRAVAAVEYPLDSLLEELGGGKKKKLEKTFAWTYLNVWSEAFVQPLKKYAGACEWVRTRGTRCTYSMDIRFAPLLKKDRKFSIKNLKISSQKYRPGDVFSGSLTVTQDSWITVLMVSGGGGVRVIVPEEGSLNGYAKAGEKFVFEAPAFFSEDDAGQGLIHIIAVKKAPLEIPDESDESDNENPQMNNRNEEEDNYIKKIARNLWNVKRPDWTAVSAVFEVLEK